MTAVYLRVLLPLAEPERYAACYETNLSRGGVFLKMRKPWSRGTEIIVAVETPEGTILDLPGQVTYTVSAEGGREAGMGVRLSLDERISAELKRLYDLATAPPSEAIPAWPCPRCSTPILSTYTYCTQCGAAPDDRSLGLEVEAAVDALTMATPAVDPPPTAHEPPALQNREDTGKFLLDAEMMASALSLVAPAAQRKDPTGEFWLPFAGPPPVTRAPRPTAAPEVAFGLEPPDAQRPGATSGEVVIPLDPKRRDPAPIPLTPRSGGTLVMDLSALETAASPAPAFADRCVECAASVKLGQRFCFHCGTPVATTCPRCHAPARPADRFCLACGASLRGSAVILR